MKPVGFAAGASADLTDAAVWYDSHQMGLGARLLGEVERLLPLLGATPAAFPRLG